MDVSDWPDYLMIRDTELHDDLGGGGQRIYTTAGRGYETKKYLRAESLEQVASDLELIIPAIERGLQAMNPGGVSDDSVAFQTAMGRVERLKAFVNMIRK